MRSYLKERVEAPVYKTEITAVGIRRADHATPLYPQKLALTSPTSGGRSVGIVRSRTEATELLVIIIIIIPTDILFTRFPLEYATPLPW
jgi:hypothetical protein